MKKLVLLFAIALLVACNANNSNVAKKELVKDSTSVVKSSPKPAKVDTMTTEETAVAAKVGAVRAYKMAEDTFKVVKKVLDIAREDFTEYEYPVDSDSVFMVGVVSASGRTYVSARYNDVHQIARDVFIGHLSVNLYDYDAMAPAYTELYQIIYKGREVGNYSHVCNIIPVYYRQKVAGFIKEYYNIKENMRFLYYVDVHGKGWDTWLGVRVGSYPHFEYYKIHGSTLTLWGGAKNPEDLKAFFPEDRSLYRVDLRNGKVLENPFVPTD